MCPCVFTHTTLSRKLKRDRTATFRITHENAHMTLISWGVGSAFRWRTFGDERVSVSAGEGAVNLAHQLHVVEEGVEGIEVGEAHHVGGAASRSLKRERDPKSVIASV